MLHSKYLLSHLIPSLRRLSISATMATMTATTASSGLLDEKTVPMTLTKNSSSTPESHYKDWPNSIGFESDYEQHTPIDLKVTGTIPAYAAGTLYRTGPGTYKVKTNSGETIEAHHWFDGFAVAHRFQIHEPEGQDNNITRVSYNSRRTCDALIQDIKKTGKIREFGFAQKRDPCQSYFKKVMSTFVQAAGKPDISLDNVGVALSVNMPGITKNASGIESLTARTDANRLLPLDPETLEPAGACDQTVLHPDLKGPLAGTHSKMDPVTGDVFNYNLDFGKNSTYRVFQVSKATGETTILAKIQATPAYLHSILLTEHTVILCVWNSHITNYGISMLWNKNILDSLAPLNPKDKAYWYIIDRSPSRKGLLATFTTEAFFCFHTINAYEQPNPASPGTVDIIADLAGYNDLSMLKSFYYSMLTSTNASESKFAGRTPVTYRRYKLPSLTLSSSNKKPRPAIRLTEARPDQSMDLPTLHPTLYTRPYRYHYGVTDHGYASFADGIGKHDNRTNTTIIWRQHGQTPGEPIFVPDPSADPFNEEEEDKGVLMSVVCDGIRELSYLLVLDAKDLREVGRAEMEAVSKGEVKRVVGFGFHGTHVKAFADGTGVKLSAGD